MPDSFASYVSAAAPAAAPAERAPIQAPAPTRTSPATEPPSRKWRLWSAIAVVVVVAVATAVWVQRSRQARSAAGRVVPTAVAERRDLVRSVRVTGTVEATRSYIVSTPTMTGGGFGTLVITKLLPSGTKVKTGDVLVEFDSQTQIQTALDREADFKDLEEQIRHKKADQDAARAKDETDLKAAEDAQKAAALEMQRNEVLSKIDAEKNRENLDQAKAQLAELRNTFELKRRAARSELRILEIQRDRARNAMLHAQENAKKSTVRATSDGVVVLNSIWKNGSMGEVAEGDEVRTGMAVMQVMNPNSMQVRARVNQEDVVLLKPDVPAVAHLDAYPEIALPARLVHIAAIGNTSSLNQRVRSFVAIFSLESSAPQVMPDLTSAVDVELSRIAGALVVPRDAVVTDHDQAFVWSKDGDGWQKRPVHVAGTNEVDAALDSGIQPGDVVLRNPERQNGGAQ